MSGLRLCTDVCPEDGNRCNGCEDECKTGNHYHYHGKSKTETHRWDGKDVFKRIIGD